MPRRHLQRPVRYAVAEHEGTHQVVDQLHGYALSSHTTHAAAEDTAQELASNPTAAIAAVEALDAAQTGPAATERRILRRYGYAWSLRQDEMLSLLGEFSYHRLEALVSTGHLTVVFSPVGQPFYTTPERFDQLSPRWIGDGQESFPAVDRARLERPRPALKALSERRRRELCELHGIALWRCMLCGPREQFECQWGACTANAVTTYCEQCARFGPRRTVSLPPSPDHW
ncbi:hypothetical protein ACSHXN_43890 (plasmid) [Streptomyces sp. HUAS TT11]|uniref:hypothetical protein n=1 Tax=Streptomyces sp. HUAS TT11 TaxID=3447508 RepID=UPI003F6577E9